MISDAAFAIGFAAKSRFFAREVGLQPPIALASQHARQTLNSFKTERNAKTALPSRRERRLQRARQYGARRP